MRFSKVILGDLFYGFVRPRRNEDLFSSLRRQGRGVREERGRTFREVSGMQRRKGK